MNARGLPRLLRLPWRSSRADVDDELQFHIDMAAADLVAQGIHPDAARAEAERRFGTVGVIRDACLTIDERRRRNAATADIMSAFLFDLRHAARSLRKTPMLTVVGSLTLMLGIGGATAIFSVVDSVLLRPLPYANADRLVLLNDVQAGAPDTPVAYPLSYPEIMDWRARGGQIFEEVGAWFSSSLTLTGIDQPIVLRGQRMSANVPAILGVRPILGRTFRLDEEKPIGDRVIMLSERFWRRQFNADTAVLGRTLTLAGYPFRVIGVYPTSPRSRLPNELSASTSSDYWQPLRLDETRAPRGTHFMSAIGRLRPGLTAELAEPRLKAVNDQLLADSVTQHVVKIADLSTRVLGSSRTLLQAIFGAGLLVLLVACANVANLLLARGASRQREVAIRTALGAGRARILSQVLSESLLRALVGGLLGIGLAYGVIIVLHKSLPVRLPRFADVAIDGRVLAFGIALSLVTGALFGLVPALRSTRSDAATVMREGGRGVAGSLRRDAFRRSLIIGEIVMSFVLLVGAGLLLRSVDRLLSVPKGFNPDRLLTASISLPTTQYNDPARQLAFYRRLLDQVRSIPGVSGAAVSNAVPMEGGTSGGMGIEGKTFPDNARPMAEKRFASGGYFGVIGARIIAGRDLSDQDAMGATQVVVVNEAFAKAYFPGENPIGKRIDYSWNTTGFQTIVGIVENVKEQGLAAAITPAAYLPVWQHSDWGMYLIVRGSIDPLSLVPALRRELRAIDPGIPLDNVRLIDEVIESGITNQRMMTTLLSGFSFVALVLAAIGLYGVISYSVAQRTQELGIRAALGAQRAELVGGVMREGFAFVVVGVVLGVLAARGAAQIIASQLFGTTVGDPLVYGAVALLLGVVSLVALMAPAIRAARVDPAIALREE